MRRAGPVPAPGGPGRGGGPGPGVPLRALRAVQIRVGRSSGIGAGGRSDESRPGRPWARKRSASAATRQAPNSDASRGGSESRSGCMQAGLVPLPVNMDKRATCTRFQGRQARGVLRRRDGSLAASRARAGPGPGQGRPSSGRAVGRARPRTSEQARPGQSARPGQASPPGQSARRAQRAKPLPPRGPADVSCPRPAAQPPASESRGAGRHPRRRDCAPRRRHTPAAAAPRRSRGRRGTDATCDRGPQGPVGSGGTGGGGITEICRPMISLYHGALSQSWGYRILLFRV